MTYSSVVKTIQEFDYDSANAHDVVVLLEQVFRYHDGLARDGGPYLVAQGVMTKYEEAVRRKAAPDLHMKVKGRCAELRSTLAQFDDSLRKLEKENAQTRT